jgi:hypothetical protein
MDAFITALDDASQDGTSDTANLALSALAVKLGLQHANRSERATDKLSCFWNSFFASDSLNLSVALGLGSNDSGEFAIITPDFIAAAPCFLTRPRIKNSIL